MIATFHSLSSSSATISRYPNVILTILSLTFFFNKKIVYMLTISAFITNASNFIMKLAMCFFSCLKVSILHLASAVLLLLLNNILVSLMNLF